MLGVKRRNSVAGCATVSRHLRVPFEQLARGQQFDRIMDVLLKETSKQNLRLWLEGSLDGSHRYFESNNLTGETPLHRIAAFQPPGE
jgi:hypothetical protein